jgi:hypothetical protein
MARASSPPRTKRLIQGRELAVVALLPPTLLELIFDAANLCTIIAMLFDLYAIAVTLRDKNYHLAIALGQISAMCVFFGMHTLTSVTHPVLLVAIGLMVTSPAIFCRPEDPSSFALLERSLTLVRFSSTSDAFCFVLHCIITDISTLWTQLST